MSCMKRYAWIALILGFAALAPVYSAPPQDPSEKEIDVAETGPKNTKEPAMVWQIANFVLLAGTLGYLIAKKAPAFFAARSEQIGRDIAEAQKLHAQAEQSAAETDRRLAHLDADIAALRAESQAEIAAETERQRQRTATEIAKIEEHGLQEIEAAGKAARADLKRFATELAIQLAETKIRGRMNAETQDILVSGFIRDLEPPHSEAKGN
jgi:F-type H+-transporting ATPase subunit b